MTRHVGIARLLGASLIALAVPATAQQEPPPGARQYVIPLLLPASHPTAEGFVRLINLSDQSGEVRIVAVDDAGRRFGPTSLTLEANAATHFNSGDLEGGNPAKGLPRGVGDGTGNWRLEIKTALELEPLAFVRGRDGFLTAMHGKIHQDRELAIFNPASNPNQRSRLRLVNRAGRETEVVIRGVDDAGESPGAEARLTLAAGEARDVTAVELEAGGEGIAGQLGDGDGKWHLSVEADGPIWAMNLLRSPTGHLTNLTSGGGERTLPFFLSASDERGRQGFARIRNLSDRAGIVHIHAFDEGGEAKLPVRLSLGAGQTAHFNSQDLEAGSAAKGLSAGVGPGQGHWHLLLDTDLAIEATAYVRHADGFLTSMHEAAAQSGGGHRVPTFNPASNDRQRSLLRLMNPSDEVVRVSISGMDDAGAWAGDVSLDVPPRGVRTLTSVDLERGGAGIAGRLGDGAGKWRLTVEADGPLRTMSLMESPTGHLSNLSAPARGEEVTLAVSLFGDGEVTLTGLPDALECSAFECRGTFEAGSRLLLEASPHVTDFETEWDGCGRADGNECEVWLDGEAFVLAAFQSPNPLTLRGNVVILTAGQLAGLTRVAEGTLHFNVDTPGAEDWAMGDVLVSEGVAGLDEDDPRSLPFARRVVAIGEEGEYILDTEPADFGDLLESGSFSSSRDGGPVARWEPPAPGAMVAPGVRYVGASPRRRGAGANAAHRYTVDRRMAHRMREFGEMLTERLVADRTARREGGLPWLLPLVLYNGDRRWPPGAADLTPPPSETAWRTLARHQPADYVLLSLERLRTEGGDGLTQLPVANRATATLRLQLEQTVFGLVRRLYIEAARFPSAEDVATVRVLRTWAEALVRQAAHRERIAPPALPSLEALRGQKEETPMTSIAEAQLGRWFRSVRTEAEAKGMARGMEQGMEQGIEQATARSLAVLRRQAAIKFGDAVAERLAALLDTDANTERMEAAGVAMMECDDGETLLARVAVTASPSE